MNQNFRKVISAAGLLCLCLLLVGCGQEAADQQAEESGDRRGEHKLDPFTSIELSVQAPHVHLEVGEEYSIRYSLHSRETIKELEVRDGVLHFSTGLDPKWKPDGSSHEVVVTIPETAELERVELRSTAGDVELTDRTVDEGILSSVSGNVSVRKLQSGRLEASSTSGDLVLEGAFDTVKGHSVSGFIELAGQVSAGAVLDTVSGEVRYEAPFGALTAESIGGVRLDGEKQGSRLSLGSGEPAVELSSISGTIFVGTAEE